MDFVKATNRQRQRNSLVDAIIKYNRVKLIRSYDRSILTAAVGELVGELDGA